MKQKITFFILDSLAFSFSLFGFKGLRVLAYIFGFTLFDIFRVRRRIILANLDIVYGNRLSQKEKKHIGRKCVVNFVSTILEFIAARHLAPKAKFEFENKELADEGVGRNQGLYVICAHFGNWEYLCHIHAKIYSPVNVVVKDLLTGDPEQWIKNLRKHLGYKFIGKDSEKTRTEQIFEAIENKEIIGFIVDQKRKRGEVLPFFNRPASTNNSLAKLYFRKPAPVGTLTISRGKPGHFKIKYYDEFIYQQDPNLTFDENVTKFTLQVNKVLEELILQNPEEYYWLHNRWSL